MSILWRNALESLPWWLVGNRKTYRSELRACAVEQHGYVSEHDVARLGIPDDIVADLVERGDLLPVAKGIYRLDGVPQTRWHAFAEAVLRVGHGAALSHDAVLALHDLVEHDPDRVRVSTPHRVHGHLPRHIEVLHRHVGTDDLTAYRGIPSTTVARALLDSRPLIAASVLAHAAEQAVERGLLLRRERHAVLAGLENG
jgi:predicted transcriptional regulator of viral defense system